MAVLVMIIWRLKNYTIIVLITINQSWGPRLQTYDKTGLGLASVVVLYFWCWSWSFGLDLSLGFILFSVAANTVVPSALQKGGQIMKIKGELNPENNMA